MVSLLFNRFHFYIKYIAPPVIFGYDHPLANPDPISVSSLIPWHVLCFQSSPLTIWLEDLFTATSRLWQMNQMPMFLLMSNLKYFEMLNFALMIYPLRLNDQLTMGH